MTILVTGATGHLGDLLVRRLLSEGHAVRVLSRRPFRASRMFGDDVGIVEWHPGVDAVPADAFVDVTAVVHLMGEPLSGPVDAGKLERVESSRAIATRRLIDGFQGRAWRLIIASIVPVSLDPEAVLTEISPRTRPPLPGEQAMLAAETAAQAARSAGASVAIVRLGLLLSPEGAVARLVRLADRGLIPVLGPTLIPAIDTADAAAMLSGLIERLDIEGPINAVAPQPLKGADLVRVLAHARRLPIRLPAPQRLLARELGLLLPLIQNRARIVPQRLAELGAQFQHPDPSARLEQIIAGLAAQPSAWLRWLPVRARPRSGVA